MNFEYIVLSRKELKRLKELFRNPSGLPIDSNETALVNNHLVSRTRYGSPDPEVENPLRVISTITQEGREYLTYIEKTRNANRIESRRFFWTTLIASIALLIAIAALVIDLWQLGLL